MTQIVLIIVLIGLLGVIAIALTFALRRKMPLVPMILSGGLIIAGITVVVVSHYGGHTVLTKTYCAKTGLDTLATALAVYKAETGMFPTTEQGLQALVTKSSILPIPLYWKEPYTLKEELIDAWGREFQYRCPGIHRPQDYDLYSLGTDGVESDDDVVNWEKADPGNTIPNPTK